MTVGSDGAGAALVALAFTVTLPLLAGACGDSASGGGDDAPGGATARDRLEVPSGDDPRAVTPYVEDLLASYNESVNRIAATPALAVDPGGPELAAYLAVFEPNSPVAAQAVAFWRNQGLVGDSTRPYEPGRPAFDTRVDGPVETVSEDEVTFPTCVEVGYETVNAQGQRIDVEPGSAVPGEATAVLVDGEWRLRRLDQFAGDEGCRGEG